MKREYPSTPDESFESAIDGSFYAKWIREARAEGRIGHVPWDKQARVSVAFDPGYLDSCALVFWQCIGQEIHIIDYYENSGEGLAHYIGVIKAKPYVYEHYFGPHDIESHQFSTGLSTKEVGASLGVHFITLQTLKLRLEDGIEAVRGCFPRFWIDEEKCGRLIKCIENYRKEFDVNHGIYKSKPLHDEYSHGCFISGTLISIDGGEVPIEDVKVGMLVKTPTGLKKVLNTFEYNSDSLIQLHYPSNSLTCTPNHKIFTDRGLLYADALRYNDVLFSEGQDICSMIGIGLKASNTGFRENFSSVTMKNVLYLGAINSVGMDHIIGEVRKESATFIKQCGELIKERYPKNGIFTIKTRTLRITASRIWNSLIRLVTPNSICEMGIGANSAVKPSIKQWNMRKNGTEAKRGELGIDCMQKELVSEKLKKWGLYIVSCVRSDFFPSNHGKNSVLQNAEPNSVTSTESTMKRETVVSVPKNLFAINTQKLERVEKVVHLSPSQGQKVYDIEVEDDHCYYANGILVSNSDALRYACIAIKTHIDSAKSGISDDEADRLYNKHHPIFK